MKKILLYSALLLAQCVGCKVKDPFPAPVTPANPVDQLPPATQTGQRTFGCLVNGQAWTPASPLFGATPFAAAYLNGRFSLYADQNLAANGKNTSSQRISIVINNIFKAGLYTLTDSTTRVGTFEDFDSMCTLHTSPNQTGTVVVTRFDPVNRVVSGTFAFTLQDSGCGQVVITDGRFDSVF